MSPLTTFTVDPGSELIINEPVSALGDAGFILENGAKLTINNTAVNLCDGSIIETKGDAEIVINGTGARLVNNGEFICEPDGLITIKGNGKADIATNQTTLPNLYLKGLNGNLTVKFHENNNYVVNGTTFYAEDVKLYCMGNIELNNVDNITIKNTLISTDQTHFQGMNIVSPQNLTIEDATFRYADNYGLRIYNNNAATYTLTRVNFRDCERGLKTYGGGINLVQCVFDGGTYGLYAQNMTRACTVNDCDITNFDILAINYTGYNDATLSIKNGTHITNNSYGVYGGGTFTIDVECCTIQNNDHYGIKAGAQTSVMAEKSNLNGNQFAITTTSASPARSFYLDRKNNDLRSDSYAINGTWTMTSANANANKWNNSGTSPVYGTDYNTLCAIGLTPLYITDSRPITTVPDCFAPGGFNPKNSPQNNSI